MSDSFFHQEEVSAKRGQLQVQLAPKLDAELARDAQRLRAQYDQARESAMTSVGARDRGLTSEQRESRLERVKAVVAEIKQRLAAANRIAEEGSTRWRKAVVQFLLLPLDEVSAESFRSQILAAISPSRRAKALGQTERQHVSMLSHEGKKRWICNAHWVKSRNSGPVCWSGSRRASPRSG